MLSSQHNVNVYLLELQSGMYVNEHDEDEGHLSNDAECGSLVHVALCFDLSRMYLQRKSLVLARRIGSKQQEWVDCRHGMTRA